LDCTATGCGDYCTVSKTKVHIVAGKREHPQVVLVACVDETSFRRVEFNGFVVRTNQFVLDPLEVTEPLGAYSLLVPALDAEPYHALRTALGRIAPANIHLVAAVQPHLVLAGFLIL